MVKKSVDVSFQNYIDNRFSKFWLRLFTQEKREKDSEEREREREGEIFQNFEIYLFWIVGL